MKVAETLKYFTSAADSDEVRLNRVWYVEPWAMASDGTFIAAINVTPAEAEGLPHLAKDFPQFARECKAYIEGQAQFASSLPRMDVDRWAGDYDAGLYESNKTRVGTTWGFPFDTNRVAKALKYLFISGVPLNVDVCTGREDGITVPTTAVTRCTLKVHSPSRVFALARSRDVDEEKNTRELQPIGNMMDEGDEAFDAILGSLE